MKLTRRTFLSATAATLTTSLIPVRAIADMVMGEIKITTISDGHLTLPRDFITGPMPKDEANAILDDYGVTGDQFMADCNVTVLQTPDHTVLFDVGSGMNFQQTAGQLVEGLSDAGISVDDVTHVIFTHAHPDHLWGVLDDFDDPVFPNAEYMIGAAEHAYWTDPITVDTIGEERLAFAAGALRYLDAIADQLTTFEDGDEVLPGVTAKMTPGHTPGHMSFVVSTGEGDVMIVGDFIGNPHIAFARPEWPSGSDQDPAAAAETRVNVMSEIVENGTTLIGFHFPFPGIGKPEPQADGGYKFKASS